VESLIADIDGKESLIFVEPAIGHNHGPSAPYTFDVFNGSVGGKVLMSMGL
jgi:hypothetical protein